MLDDLVRASPDVLAAIADKAFRLGLRDGYAGKKQLNSHELREALPQHPMRTVHRLKLRHVYGAGYDIAEANSRIAGGGTR